MEIIDTQQTTSNIRVKFVKIKQYEIIYKVKNIETVKLGNFLKMLQICLLNKILTKDVNKKISIINDLQNVLAVSDLNNRQGTRAGGRGDQKHIIRTM